MVWDRMFGTFVAEDPKEPCDYGLVVPMTSLNPLRILFEEYANIFKDISMRGISLKDRLCIFSALLDGRMTEPEKLQLKLKKTITGR